jgi:hypothetical protein
MLLKFSSNFFLLIGRGLDPLPAMPLLYDEQFKNKLFYADKGDAAVLKAH